MNENNKTETIKIRITKEEKEKIRYNASLLNVSITSYIMMSLSRKRLVVFNEFPEIVIELSRIGNNINQIAHVANSTKKVTESQIVEIKSLLRKSLDMFHQFIGYVTEKESNPPKDFENSSPEALLYEIYRSTKRIERRLGKIKSETSRPEI